MLPDQDSRDALIGVRVITAFADARTAVRSLGVAQEIAFLAR